MIQCSSRSCKSHWFLALLLAENLGETVKLRDCGNHCTSHSGHTLCHLLNFRRELDLKNLKKGMDAYCIQYIHMLYLDTSVNWSVLTIRKPRLIYIFRAFPCCTLTVQTHTHTCMAQDASSLQPTYLSFIGEYAGMMHMHTLSILLYTCKSMHMLIRTHTHMTHDASALQLTYPSFIGEYDLDLKEWVRNGLAVSVDGFGEFL